MMRWRCLMIQPCMTETMWIVRVKTVFSEGDEDDDDDEHDS